MLVWETILHVSGWLACDRRAVSPICLSFHPKSAMTTYWHRCIQHFYVTTLRLKLRSQADSANTFICQASGQPWKAFFFLILLCVTLYIWRGQRKAFRSQVSLSISTAITHSSTGNCLGSVQLLIMENKNIIMNLLSHVQECLQGI